MDLNPDTPVFPIGVVRKLTGLTERQIRYYDKTGLVVPERTGGNKRRYSARELEKLLRIKEIICPGMKIRQVKEKLAEEAAYSRREGDYQRGTEIPQGYSKVRQRPQRLYAPGYLDQFLTRLLREDGG